MGASILQLPVVRKRGRKVSKGPAASVSVIYEGPQPPEEWGPIGTYEEEMGRLDALMKARLPKWIESQAQARAWIELSPTVVAWPESRRVRSPSLIEQLKRGGSDEEPEVEPDVAAARAENERRIAARCLEILSATEGGTLVA